MNESDNNETNALVKAQGTGIQKVPGGLVRRGMEDVVSLTNSLTAKDWFERGLAATDPDEQVVCYTNAIQLDTEWSLPYINRGIAFYEKGDYDQSIVDYSRALQIDPNGALTYFYRALALVAERDYDRARWDRAIADLNAALKIDPNWAEALKERGELFFVVGELDRAIADFDHALQIDPHNADASYNRGLVYDELARNKKRDLSPEVFLTVSADKTILWKNDAALITYRLYLRINVFNYELINMPQANGFLNEELPIKSKPVLKDESVKGVRYKAAIIRKIRLSPTRIGTLTLDSMVLSITVQRPDKEREVISISCEPLNFTVLDSEVDAALARLRALVDQDAKDTLRLQELAAKYQDLQQAADSGDEDAIEKLRRHGFPTTLNTEELR